MTVHAKAAAAAFHDRPDYHAPGQTSVACDPARRGAGRPAKPLPPMSEDDLMAAVTDLATILGYSWAHFRPAKTSKGWRTPVSGSLGKGWPDLVLARERDGRLLFVELKSAKGSPTPEQDHVARVLGTAARYFLWRPRHLDSGEIASVLR